MLKFVGTKWADGKSFSDRIWDNAAKLAEYVSGDMAKALARGDSYAKLRDEIARRFVGQSVSNIMRVVQTEGTYVSRQVQGEEMRKAGFDAYYINSIEDSRTCDTCRRISARSHEEPFRFEDAKPGENYPPLHPRCRCEVNPAVDDWADFIKGGTDGPQDMEKAAERFGASPPSPAGNSYESRLGDRIERRFRGVRFKTGQMRWKDYRELKAAAVSSSNRREIRLDKSEYARVMSELATYVPMTGIAEGKIVKAIGDYVYTVEVNDHDYRIISRRPIE